MLRWFQTPYERLIHTITTKDMAEARNFIA